MPATHTLVTTDEITELLTDVIDAWSDFQMEVGTLKARMRLHPDLGTLAGPNEPDSLPIDRWLADIADELVIVESAEGMDEEAAR